jgi:hypothetical protein
MCSSSVVPRQTEQEPTRGTKDSFEATEEVTQL